MSLDETLDLGEDTGAPVSKDYSVPYRDHANIERVTVTLKNQVSGEVDTEQPVL